MNNFWNHGYRHQMRDLRPSKQKEVYDTFIEFDLDLDGKSDMHLDLMNEVIGDYTIQGENKNNREKRLKYSYSTRLTFEENLELYKEFM